MCPDLHFELVVGSRLLRRVPYGTTEYSEEVQRADVVVDDTAAHPDFVIRQLALLCARMPLVHGTAQ